MLLEQELKSCENSDIKYFRINDTNRYNVKEKAVQPAAENLKKITNFKKNYPFVNSQIKHAIQPHERFTNISDISAALTNNSKRTVTSK